MAVAVQLSVLGLYLPPVFKLWVWSPFWLNPPHMIISLPVHTAVWLARGSGAFTVVAAVQVLSVQSSGTAISGSSYAASGGSAAPRAMVARAEGQELVIVSRLALPSSKGLLDPPLHS